MNYLIYGSSLILFSGILSLLFKNKLKISIVTIFSILGSILLMIPAVYSILFGKMLAMQIYLGPIFGACDFVIDPLSAFFILFICVMSSLGLIYANGYLAPYIEKGKNTAAHCIFLPMLISSMIGVVTCQNALMFLVIWELMSLSSFFLVIFESEKKEVIDAGIKYLIYMHISVIFIILFFALLSVEAGSLNFADFANVIANNKHFATISFILAFIGFGLKAGFVPFHNWLPSAHPAAPSHVSGMMSGVMIKTGIYGILRALTFIGIPDVHLSYFVLILSVLSASYGVLYAIAQYDVKKLLAYSSIENIAIIGIGIGVGMLGMSYNNPLVALLGFSGAILHIFNHSIFKELLFFAAGAVYTKTHTRDIEVLGGLIKTMPRAALLFLIGSIAICGLPPFNGFISEFLIYFGMVKGVSINSIGALMVLFFSLAILALVGTMAILCFTKMFSIIFLGAPRSEHAQKVTEDVGLKFVIPMAILALFTIIIGLFPTQVFALILSPVSVLTQIGSVELLSPIFGTLSVISFVSFAFLFVVIVLFAIKHLKSKNDTRHETWGCGYNKPTARMQYSASSYASPFINMMTPLFVKVSDVKKPKEIFPKEAHYTTHMEDIEESYFLKPIVKSIEKFLQRFEKIQNGNIQYYISFGLIFLLLALIGVLVLG